MDRHSLDDQVDNDRNFSDYWYCNTHIHETIHNHILCLHNQSLVDMKHHLRVAVEVVMSVCNKHFDMYCFDNLSLLYKVVQFLDLCSDRYIRLRLLVNSKHASELDS